MLLRIGFIISQNNFLVSITKFDLLYHKVNFLYQKSFSNIRNGQLDSFNDYLILENPLGYAI